jgi:class 3 adenylate cyclase
MEVISYDDQAHEVEVRIKPNPLRYERREVNGVFYLYDRFDDVSFEEREFMRSLGQHMEGQPIYYQPGLLNGAQYLLDRRAAIDAQLSGEARSAPTFADKSEEFLRGLDVDQLGFVVLSVDVVRSTHLATTVAPGVYAKTIGLILFELSAVIPRFHGHVLKYTGDGLIAYFPEPPFISKNDLALRCSLMLLRVIRESLNPSFARHGLPEVQIRIGLEAGDAYIETIGSPDAKQHKDIIGDVVNLAFKIQETATPGEVFLGEVTERNLHTVWRSACEAIAPTADWPYRTRSGGVYRVYRFKEDRSS